MKEYRLGIYYLSGIVNFPVQVVVTKKLEGKDHVYLRVLTKGADEDDVRRFVTDMSDEHNTADKMNADAVLQVSVAANWDLFEKIRKELPMCEALKELMKDELDEARKEGGILERKKVEEEMAEKDARIAELEELLREATKK